jgi:hypothetical protein
MPRTARPQALKQALRITAEPRESDVQRQILEMLRYRGVTAWRVNNTGKLPGGRWASRSSVGMADIIACHRERYTGLGRFLAIEVKQPGGIQSEGQIEFQRQLENAGGVYVLATCPEDVTEALDRMEAVR